MKWFMGLMLAATVTFGGTAVALEVGDKIGPVYVNPGSVICDTVQEVMQAVETATPYPTGCGRLVRMTPAYIEALSEHDLGRRTFLLLKLTFAPQSDLGIQYGWEIHEPNGQPI